jgi:hypothetical protein
LYQRSFEALSDVTGFLSVLPVSSFDGGPHLVHLLGIEDAAKLSKRSAANKPLYGIAERLVVALVSFDSFIYVILKANLL